MINLPIKYDMEDPANLGYMALALSICKKKSADESMRLMGIKLPHEDNQH